MQTSDDRRIGLADCFVAAAIVKGMTPDVIPVPMQYGLRVGLFVALLALLALWKPAAMKLFFGEKAPRLSFGERMAGFARALIGACCGTLPAWLIYAPGKAWLEPVVGMTAADWITGSLGVIALVTGYVLGVELVDRRSTSAAA